MRTLGGDRRMVTRLVRIFSYADYAAEKPGWNYRQEYFSILASVSQCGAL